MEESAQRRERLKVMRMEASQEDATFNIDHSAVNLSNPFLESTTNSQTTSQSFNYYTNQMAAYSGNKRSQVSPQMAQDYSSTPQSNTILPYSNHKIPNFVCVLVCSFIHAIFIFFTLSMLMFTSLHDLMGLKQIIIESVLS
ncbi:hypothetical protein R6Q59_015022 [Mikania micrantha]